MSRTGTRRPTASSFSGTTSRADDRLILGRARLAPSFGALRGAGDLEVLADEDVVRGGGGDPVDGVRGRPGPSGVGGRRRGSISACWWGYSAPPCPFSAS